MSAPSRRRMLLHCYPRVWRDRYGDELEELLARSSAGGRPSPQAALDVARAGLGERLRASGLTGDQRPPRARVLARTLLVLCSWSLFVLGGVGVQKLSEHWESATSVGDRALAEHAFETLQIAAMIGSALVLVGIGLALPSFVTLLRSSGGAAMRRPVLRALASTAVALIGGAGIVLWAHGLDASQRNGHDLGYSLAVLGAALPCAVALASWTAAAVAAAQRLALTPRLLRAEVVIAALVAVSMLSMLASTVTWWLAGSGVGSQVAVPLLAMIVASVLGAVGAVGAVCELEPDEGSPIG